MIFDTIEKTARRTTRRGQDSKIIVSSYNERHFWISFRFIVSKEEVEQEAEEKTDNGGLSLFLSVIVIDYIK